MTRFGTGEICGQRAIAAELPVGSHLVTPRRAYLHHGIYVGFGKVVHYAGLAHGLHRRPVEEVTLDVFASGRAVLVLMDAPAAFDRMEVVRRARSRIGENSYRLFTNNCEHFCEWCLRGVGRSYQVEAVFASARHLVRAVRRLDRMCTALADTGSRLSTKRSENAKASSSETS